METASLWSWVAQYLGKLATSAAFSPMDASNVSHFFNGLLEVKRPVRLNLLEPKFRNIEQRNMLFGPFHLPNINIFRICLVLWKMAKQENPANVPMIFYGWYLHRIIPDIIRKHPNFRPNQGARCRRRRPSAHVVQQAIDGRLHHPVLVLQSHLPGLFVKHGPKMVENPWNLLVNWKIAGSYIWIYMDLNGFIWIYMDLYGFKWIYMDLYRCMGYIGLWPARWHLKKWNDHPIYKLLLASLVLDIDHTPSGVRRVIRYATYINLLIWKAWRHFGVVTPIIPWKIIPVSYVKSLSPWYHHFACFAWLNTLTVTPG